MGIRLFNKVKYARQIITSGFIFLILGSLSLSIWRPKPALAAVTATFIDKATIQIDNNNYVDINPFDGTNSYLYKHDGCVNNIFFDDFGDNNKISATLYLQKTFNSKCVEDGSTKLTTFNGLGSRWIQGYKISADLIWLPQTLGWHSGDFNSGTGSAKTFKKNSSGDTEYLVVDSNGSLNDYDNGGSRIRSVDANTGSGTYDVQRGGCFGECTHSHSIQLADNGRVAKPDAKVYPNAPGAGGSVADDGTPSAANSNSCESHGGALSWILCPFIEIISSAVNALDNAIQNQLTTPNPNSLENGRNGVNTNSMKETWGRIRNLALIILIPIMLAMVIGTAIGVSALDAYTVKRAMPRLLIAVIFISLSWELTTRLIEITNVIGSGVYGLMTQPFGLANVTLGDLISTGSGAASTFLVAGGLAVGFIAGAVTLPIILSLALAAAAALFLGFCVLVLRNVFIYVLVLLAPLAILAWIFPNNDKMWKLWWGTFSKLLLMYPMIMALIASGKIFASIIPVQQGDNGGLFTNAAILIAYIAPYFLIPLTFKFAGGAFGNLAGMINDRGRGVFDRTKKYRQGQRAEGWQRFKAGDGRGRLRQTAFARRTGQGIGAGWSGHYGFGERGRQKIGGNMQTAGEQYLKDNPNAAKVFIAQDDTAALMGLSGGTVSGARVARAALRQQWIDQAVAGGATVEDATAAADTRANRAYESAMALGVSTSAATAALSVMSQNKSRAIASGNYEIVQEGINRLANGNEQLAQDLSYNYQYNSRQAQRIDLGGDWTGAAVAAAPTAALRRRAVFMDGVKRTGTQELVRGYTASTDQAITTIMDDFASGDVTRRLDAAALVAEMQGNLSQASGENRDRISGMLATLGIDTNGSPEDIETQLVGLVNAGGATVTQAELSNYVRNWSRATAAPPPGGPPTPPPPPPSDRRLKTDIKYIKTLENGIKIYSFKYLWSNQSYVGVMAQDLLSSYPEAIIKDSFGYYSVKYGALGLRMLTLEEWQAGKNIESVNTPLKIKK